MMITETMIVREICDYLQSHGYFFWRENNIPAPGRGLPKYTPRGIADIIVVIEGKIFALEVKRQASTTVREKNGRTLRGGDLRPEQADWGAKLALNGGKYQCVRSLEDAISFLGGLG